MNWTEVYKILSYVICLLRANPLKAIFIALVLFALVFSLDLTTAQNLPNSLNAAENRTGIVSEEKSVSDSSKTSVVPSHSINSDPSSNSRIFHSSYGSAGRNSVSGSGIAADNLTENGSSGKNVFSGVGSSEKVLNGWQHSNSGNQSGDQSSQEIRKSENGAVSIPVPLNSTNRQRNVLPISAVSGAVSSDRVIGVPAADPVSHRPVQYVLTRQGIIREGIVFDRDNSVYVQMINQKGGFTISKLDILHIGISREDLFVCRLAQIPPSDIGEQLKLADWAVRNQLIPSAVRMLQELLPTVTPNMKAIIEKKIRELETVERIRLQSLNTRANNASEFSSSDPFEKEKICWDKWARTFPVSVQDQFFRSVQPLLLKRCGTEGCHHESDHRVLTFYHCKKDLPVRVAGLKNLATVFKKINFLEPVKSSILTHPNIQDEKGVRIYPFGSDNNSLHDYKAFFKWIESTSGKMQSAEPSPDDQTEKASKISGQNSGQSGNSDKIDNGSPNMKDPMKDKDQTASSGDLPLRDSPALSNVPSDTDSLKNSSADSAQTRSQNENLSGAANQFVIQKADKNKKISKTSESSDSPESGKKRVANPVVIPKDVYDPVQFNSRYHPEKLN